MMLRREMQEDGSWKRMEIALLKMEVICEQSQVHTGTSHLKVPPEEVGDCKVVAATVYLGSIGWMKVEERITWWKLKADCCKELGSGLD